MASIDKHGKGYRVRVYYYDENNKRKCVTKSGFKTLPQAKKAALEMEYNLGTTILKTNVPTLKDYVDDYIETFRIGKVSPSSVDIDKNSAKRLFSIKIKNDDKTYTTINLHDPNTPIDKVTNTSQQQVINTLIKYNYSSSTIRKTNALLYRVMERARFDGYIVSNPAEFIEYKTTDNIRPVSYIPKDMVEPFLKDVKRRNVYHYFLFRLIVETGLRIGEACALTWQDIDRENNIIHITKSYDQKRDILGNTKTKAHRDVYITKKLSVELFKLLQIHNANKIVNEKIYDNKYNFIFVDDLGKPLSRSSVHNTMQYCSEKILGYKLSIHHLRHTHATLLLEADVPMKIISERLGHSTSEMTEKVYAHVTPVSKKKSFENFEKFIKDVL